MAYTSLFFRNVDSYLVSDIGLTDLAITGLVNWFSHTFTEF